MGVLSDAGASGRKTDGSQGEQATEMTGAVSAAPGGASSRAESCRSDSSRVSEARIGVRVCVGPPPLWAPRPQGPGLAQLCSS